MNVITFSSLNQQTSKWEVTKRHPFASPTNARNFLLKWVDWERSEGAKVESLKDAQGEIISYRSHKGQEVTKVEIFRTRK